MDYCFYILACFVVGLLVLICILAFLAFVRPKRQRFSVRGKHVFITGGSKGIGKELAVELLRRGARTVSIAARGLDSLKEAKEQLDTFCKHEGQTTECYSLDVTAGYDKIEEVVREAEQRSGPIDLLINNAGFVVQGAFDEIPTDSFLKQMQINYIGGAQLARAVVRQMKERRSGHVCFVSSAAGQCAIWGYSAYSPSKFAIRGLADVLHMELMPFNIGVSVVYPPNTDTEGFVVEKQEMPEEVRLISDSAGLFSAGDVARRVVDGIQNGSYAITIGFEGWMLGALTSGASPEPSAFQAILQSLFGGLFRAIMLFYLWHFDSIVKKVHTKKQATKEQN